MQKCFNSCFDLQVLRVSAQTKEGIPKSWDVIQEYFEKMTKVGEIESVRQKQHIIWMWSHIKEQIIMRFKMNSHVKKKIKSYENLVAEGLMTPGLAADMLLKIFERSSDEQN